MIDALAVPPASGPVAAETSVLVRYLVQDNAEMGAAAASLLDGTQEIAISVVTLAETAFVLARVYELPRTEVVDKLVGLLRRRNIRLLGVDKTLAATALLLCRPPVG